MALSAKHRPRAQGHYYYIRQVLRLRVPFALATLVLAVLGGLANLSHADRPLRPLDASLAIHPVTALCLLGLGLSILTTRRFGAQAMWRYAIGALILVICGARIIEVGLFSTRAGGLAMAVFGSLHGSVGTFSLNAALALGAFAAASMLRQFHGRLGMWFLIVGLALVYNAVLQLSYTLTRSGGEGGVLTVLGLLGAACATTTVYVHRPAIRVLFSFGEIGSQTRAMAMASVLLPLVSGYALYGLQDMSSTPHAGMVTFITWALLMVVMSTSARHEGLDAIRRQAERATAVSDGSNKLAKTLSFSGMSDAVEAAWLDFRSHGTHYGVILLDLAYFNRINAVYGEQCETSVLERISETMNIQLRDNDAFGRWGNDEFLILLKAPSRSLIERVAERLNRALCAKTGAFCAGLTKPPRTLKVSFGISDMRYEDHGPADAITRADVALFQTLQPGKQPVLLHYDLSAA